jgi:hypothetical protein
MRPVMIVDLDNCISDDSRRVPLIDWDAVTPDKRYAAYHADAINDLYVPLPFNDLSGFHVKVAIFTARPEAYRQVTMDWLAKNNINWSWLFMRADGCTKPSPELKRVMYLSLISGCGAARSLVKVAVDDREDVLQMYREFGVTPVLHAIHPEIVYEPPACDCSCACGVPCNCGCDGDCQNYRAVTAADILADMADTFRERNKVYGSNYKMVAPLVKALFPDGVPPELVVTDQWHLFELKLVKLSRFAISNLTHTDSIHDDAVYSAMIESIIREEKRHG